MVGRIEGEVAGILRVGNSFSSCNRCRKETTTMLPPLHMACTVADFDRERLKADPIAMGIQNVCDGGLYSLHMTDPSGFDVQISGLANTAVEPRRLKRLAAK